MKYVKKPVEVEAWKAFDFSINDKVPSWVVGAFLLNKVYETTHNKEKGDYAVETLEGKMFFRNGDYLVKGVKGELYAVRGDIFEETYEEVI